MMATNAKNNIGNVENNRFKVPYVNSRFVMPILLISTLFGLYAYDANTISNFFSYENWDTFKEKIPLISFWIVGLTITYFSILKQLSLIPVLGLLCNFYLMTELGFSNWVGFGIWLIAGLIVYFSYGYHKSKLNK
jgi:hypothetical protein